MRCEPTSDGGLGQRAPTRKGAHLHCAAALASSRGGGRAPGCSPGCGNVTSGDILSLGYWPERRSRQEAAQNRSTGTISVGPGVKMWDREPFRREGLGQHPRLWVEPQNTALRSTGDLGTDPLLRDWSPTSQSSWVDEGDPRWLRPRMPGRATASPRDRITLSFYFQEQTFKSRQPPLCLVLRCTV